MSEQLQEAANYFAGLAKDRENRDAAIPNSFTRGEAAAYRTAAVVLESWIARPADPLASHPELPLS